MRRRRQRRTVIRGGGPSLGRGRSRGSWSSSSSRGRPTPRSRCRLPDRCSSASRSMRPALASSCTCCARSHRSHWWSRSSRRSRIARVVATARVVVATAAGRSGVCLLMANHLTTLFFFPEAFAVLVLGKTYSIAKSALVPRLVDDPGRLVAADAADVANVDGRWAPRWSGRRRRAAARGPTGRGHRGGDRPRRRRGAGHPHSSDASTAAPTRW